MIKKWDIWLVDLEPIKWQEQWWTRPCLIYQNNILNKKLNVCIVIPITSTIKNSPITLTLERFKNYWLKKLSCLLLFQLRVISKKRFISKLGSIEDKSILDEINVKLINIFDFNNKFG